MPVMAIINLYIHLTVAGKMSALTPLQVRFALDIFAGYRMDPASCRSPKNAPPSPHPFGFARPGNATPDPGLWLAGDYTASPTPATPRIRHPERHHRRPQRVLKARGLKEVGCWVCGTQKHVPSSTVPLACRGTNHPAPPPWNEEARTVQDCPPAKGDRGVRLAGGIVRPHAAPPPNPSPASPSKGVFVAVHHRHPPPATLPRSARQRLPGFGIAVDQPYLVTAAAPCG